MSKAMEDFEAKCREFFDRVNGGEPVSIGQLTRVIREAVPTYDKTDAEIAEMFREVDDNEDKLISFDEFKEALMQKDPASVERAELKAAFERFDEDGSGKISRDEMRRIMSEYGVIRSEEVVDELMAQADPNGDGVDFKEFLNAWGNQ